MAFLGVDAVVGRVPSLEAGLAFYRDALGHSMIWRRPDAVGLRMGDGPTELVLMTSITVAAADGTVIGVRRSPS